MSNVFIRGFLDGATVTDLKRLISLADPLDSPALDNLRAEYFNYGESIAEREAMLLEVAQHAADDICTELNVYLDLVDRRAYRDNAHGPSFHDLISQCVYDHLKGVLDYE